MVKATKEKKVTGKPEANKAEKETVNRVKGVLGALEKKNCEECDKKDTCPIVKDKQNLTGVLEEGNVDALAKHLAGMVQKITKGVMGDMLKDVTMNAIRSVMELYSFLDDSEPVKSNERAEALIRRTVDFLSKEFNLMIEIETEKDDNGVKTGVRLKSVEKKA